MADKGPGMLPILLIGGAGVVFWLWKSQSSAAVTPPATPSGSGPPPPPAAPSAPPATPGPTALDKLYTAMVNAATVSAQGGNTANLLSYKNGTVSASFSAFNYFLAQVGGFSDLPDYFTATGGKTDPNTAMTSAQYWGVISPWLKTNKGYSGLGVYGGLA